MTKLGVLRNQLASLRRARQFVRSAAALAAPVTAVLWVLAALFVLDVVFEMSVAQRAIMLLVGIAAIGAAVYYLALPLLSVVETELEMALMVERQQKIESDLVAALQFESPDAVSWGSPTLEGAVVDYVAQLGSGLNVFEGFSRKQMTTRAAALAISAMLLGGAALVNPAYTQAFLNRLLLGSRHYPTATVFEQIVVNNEPVLIRAKGQDTSPTKVNCAQGRPLEFVVQCSGVLPEKGTARLSGIGGGSNRELELVKLNFDQRRDRLAEAEARLKEAVAKPELDLKGPWELETTALARFDAPAAVAPILAAADDRKELTTALKSIEELLADWPAKAVPGAVYVGHLSRLADAVSYKIYLGDAWTDPALVTMIPLPVVESSLDVTVPDYARSAGQKPSDPNARQISVLEGSSVTVSIKSTNKKPLAEAWLVARVKEESQRHALVKQDAEGLVWKLPESVTAFAHIDEEIRFEIQVTDRDNLHLESPIQGQIRLKPDRAPSGTATVVHKVVLPAAKPRVEYRANDDYGIAKLLIHTQVERLVKETPAAPNKPFPFGEPPPPPAEPTPNEPGDAAPADPPEKLTAVLPLSGGKIVSPNLPVTGYHDLSLASLKFPKGPLVKGDRLKVTLEVVDYRGRLPGVSYLSDPLVLEISDESGVLAAISEADARSEERLSDIIKQQLGIGEQP